MTRITTTLVSLLWTVLSFCFRIHQDDIFLSVSAFNLPTTRRNYARSVKPSSRPPSSRSFLTTTTTRSATVVPTDDRGATRTSSSSSSLGDLVLKTLASLKDEANEYADAFGLDEQEAAFYALFASLRKAPVPLGLKGQPFVLRHADVCGALEQNTGFPGFFTMSDLERAVQDDFLDAARGSTDNRKGWQITDVSQPRGESFEEARMTFGDVQAALERGTVIMNAAGAHIPKLAAPSLACTDATYLPCALNLYVTAAGKRTSAPPHTDKQDVCVIQTSGRKHWKVYSPPDPALKPAADMFARGKNDDSLPLYSLEEMPGCDLLLEITTHPGDVLFIPAAFPHTTSTVTEEEEEDGSAPTDETSVHLTMGIDHHIWELDYLSARRLAYRRACCAEDVLLGREDNRYTGKANELPDAIRKDLFAALPLDLLSDEEETWGPLVDETAAELERISRSVDAASVEKIDPSIWKATIERVREQGVELFETHRDMYLAAIEEGRTREAENAMTAHLSQQQSQQPRTTMSPERIQRLSLFRVKRFYDQINKSKQDLQDWSYAGTAAASSSRSGGALAANWAFTAPVKVGDEVEANLGGAFFSATVTRVAPNGTYDVRFFDGDQETGLERSQIKLLNPPVANQEEQVDTANMTPKQLRRWKKQQEKLKKKRQ